MNEFFTSPPKSADGHEKWVDFLLKFWHAECVFGVSRHIFTERYRRWCERSGYKFSESKADEIYNASRGHVALLPKNDTTEILIKTASEQVNGICASIAVLLKQMTELASSLPEYPAVIALYGVGENLAARIIAEIGDISRFKTKNSLVCFAGLEAPPHESGKFESHNRNISKKGSPHLRKALFQVMTCIIQKSPSEDPIYAFLDKKRSESKHYYVYMNAGCAKFLRIYFARVNEYLNT